MSFQYGTGTTVAIRWSMLSPATSTACRHEKFEEWLQLIRSEYAEMPGLHLSKRQAQRLWALEPACLEALLETLESTRFLRRMDKDCYVRADLGAR
jgi:hypothetical protein